MPSKKRFNSRFPPARIKKIMQTDEDIGKVAAPVPVLISRALELFLEQILTKTSEIVTARSAKTLSKSHIKHAVMNENQFDFLKDLVADIEDIPEIAADPANKDNGHVTRRYRKRKVKDSDMDTTEKDPSEEKDSDSSRTEDEASPTHGRKDYMLPVVVSVEDEQSPVSKDSDSVASLPVPIATPMASPNTSALVISDQIVSQAVEDEDDDYDS